jgi:hypothetical protein
MYFDPYNRSLKIQESIKTLTPKMGAHLGMQRFIKFSYIPRSMRCDSWASLLACILASPCLGCEPKVRVVTKTHHKNKLIVIKIKNGRRKLLL